MLLCCQFTERALARNLLDPLGGPSTRHYVALALLHLQTHDVDKVEADVKAALQIDYQVLLPQTHTNHVIVTCQEE